VEDARNAIVGQLTGLVGATAANAIHALLRSAHETTSNGVTATIIGAVTLLVGATTVLVELQDDLDLIWKAPKRAGSGLFSLFRARMLSLGMILAIGFLLLVSLVLSGAMAALGAYSEAYFPQAALILLRVSSFVFSLCVLTVLFAMLYKWLPNVPIAWRDVWIGAFTTAVLFSAGRVAIGFYLGHSAIASAYGAAGTLVVLLLWLYYSAQVFLFGAEFTAIFSKYRARQAEG
jgi:membrane protein